VSSLRFPDDNDKSNTYRIDDAAYKQRWAQHLRYLALNSYTHTTDDEVDKQREENGRLTVDISGSCPVYGWHPSIGSRVKFAVAPLGISGSYHMHGLIHQHLRDWTPMPGSSERAAMYPPPPPKPQVVTEKRLYVRSLEPNKWDVATPDIFKIYRKIFLVRPPKIAEHYNTSLCFTTDAAGGEHIWIRTENASCPWVEIIDVDTIPREMPLHTGGTFLVHTDMHPRFVPPEDQTLAGLVIKREHANK